MKKLIFVCMLAGLFLTTANAQSLEERRGYEGDFFSLEGALELFKQSRSVRDFERKLNTRDNWVNNLDLDLDGRTDYVRVEHRRDGRLHAIIMQIHVNRYDVQDVAVIEIEKTGNRQAILQIIGDEDLYGEEIIVEPIEGVATSNGGGQFDDQFYDGGTSYGNDYVNVYHWRAVNRLFDYDYQIYSSPYRWSYYPTWWSPWNVCAWNVYRPRIRHYHRWHHIVYIHRVRNVHIFYRPHRSFCTAIVFRSNQQRVRHGRQPIYSTKDNPNPNRGPVANGSSTRPTKGTKAVVSKPNGKKPGVVSTKPNRGIGTVSTKPGQATNTVSSRRPNTSSTTRTATKPSATSSRTPNNLGGKYRTSTRSSTASSSKPGRDSNTSTRSSSKPDRYSSPSKESSRASSNYKGNSSSSSSRGSRSSSSYSKPSTSSRSSSSASRSSSSYSKPSSSSRSSSKSSSSYSKPSRSSSSKSSSSRSSSSYSKPSKSSSKSSSSYSKPSRSSSSKSSSSRSSSSKSSSRSSSSKGKRSN